MRNFVEVCGVARTAPAAWIRTLQQEQGREAMMAKREHVQEPLGQVDPLYGYPAHVTACADNTSYAILTDDGDGGCRAIFGGKIVAEWRRDSPKFSLSFDGTKLATAERRVERGERIYEISVNGESAYESTLVTIHHFDWLDDGRLAWEGWNEDDGSIDDDGVRYVVNGKDVTGSLQFEPVLMERRRHAVIIHENGKRYTVFDDGSRSETVDVPMDVDIMRWHEDGWPETRRRREIPETVRDEKTGRVRMRYRGVEGPWFDEFETMGGLGGTVFDERREKIAHVGCTYAAPARLMGRVVGSVLEKAETVEGRTKHSPLWAWPIALLFNPYFGPGYLYAETSKRYRPVDGAKAWKRGYRAVRDIFYAPSGALAAVVVSGRGMRLVIDEDEGPSFDEIYNARAGKDGKITYLARTGNRFVRVTVDG